MNLLHETASIFLPEKNNPIDDEGRDAEGSLAEARYRGIRDVEEGQGWVNVDHCD